MAASTEEILEGNQLIDQYRLYGDWVSLLVKQRWQLQALLLILSTGLLALAATLTGFSVGQRENAAELVVSFIGIGLSVVWLMALISLGHAVQTRLAVLRSLEDRLPSKPFTAEWEETRSAMVKSTSERIVAIFERAVPVMFLLAFSGLGLLALILVMRPD